METITLEKIHKDILDLKKDIKELKEFMHEDFELAEDVVKEIEDSRKKPKSKFISNQEMRDEFG